MNACDGLIDFSAEREMLESGYRKVLRIQNFSKEFNQYVIEVKAIEEALTSGFRAIIAEDPDPTNQKWKAVLQNLNTKGNSRYTLQQLSSIRMSAGVATYLERENFFTVNPELQELVQINEDGSYTFEELLQKDMSELTDAELKKLKSLYQEICESIEQVDGKDACLIQKDMLEKYLKNLYKLDIVYEYSYYGGKSIDECKVVSNDELILALMDKENGSTMAENILSSIYGTETKIDRIWYSGWFASDMMEEIETQALVNVNLELTEVSLNRDGWYQKEDIAAYSDEEITDAMLLILYGKNGVELDDARCISVLKSVTEIEPRLFSICVTEINRKIAPGSKDESLQDLWSLKRSGYEGVE